MSSLNTDRALYRIVHELAEEIGAAVTTLGHGWIIRVERRGVVRAVYGFTFDLSSAATHAIATDKAATAEVLKSRGIPAVEHRLFLHPKMGPYVPHAGNWAGMLEFAAGHGFNVVVKENMGTGGQGVVRVKTARELEQAVEQAFQRTHAVALSPFIDIRGENRFVVLNGRCELAYAKIRPCVVGDGRRTVLELLGERSAEPGERDRIARTLAAMDPMTLASLTSVPGAGTEFLLNWRHNLGQGAMPRLLDLDDPGVAAMASLAVRAAGSLDLAFGSVDVVETPRGEMVLEANSGVMMEFLARDRDNGYETAKGIYRRAMHAMFGLAQDEGGRA